MSAYTQNFYHAVFGTKHREPLITPGLEERLYPFLGGTLRDLDAAMIAVGGMADHVHVLAQYPSKLSHAEMLREMKARTSRWIHAEFPDIRGFAWQEGYGGFTVSMSSVPAVKDYIARQKRHHQRRTFEEEFVEFLRKHQIAFDPTKLFG